MENAKNRYHKGKICNYCGGRGKVIERKLNPDTGIIDDKELICITCNGKGWVKNV
jgi:DnaJ-class molecular chaperone